MKLFSFYGTKYLNIGIHFNAFVIKRHKQNINNPKNKVLKEKKLYSLGILLIISIIGIWRKKGPKVNEPILLIKFLFILLKAMRLYSFNNKNTAQAYKIAGKFK